MATASQAQARKRDAPVPPCAAGQLLFEEFLRTEYSEENLLFWLACQDYKKLLGGAEMAAAAKRIHAEFVQVDAPRQVMLAERERRFLMQH